MLKERIGTRICQHSIDLGVQDRIKFLGFQANIPQLMAACDVVTHTSVAPEPSSRVLIEAMLGERPLIATNEGGTVESVEDEVTGWLVPPNDPNALAAKLLEVYEHPGNTRQVALKAHSTANQRFSIESTWQQVDQLFRSVLST